MITVYDGQVTLSTEQAETTVEYFNSHTPSDAEPTTITGVAEACALTLTQKDGREYQLSQGDPDLGRANIEEAAEAFAASGSVGYIRFIDNDPQDSGLQFVQFTWQKQQVIVFNGEMIWEITTSYSLGG